MDIRPCPADTRFALGRVDISRHSRKSGNPRKGETLALYLEEVTPSAGSDVKKKITAEVFYLTLTWDNAIFDASTGSSGAVASVDDNTVFTPRGVGPGIFDEDDKFKLSEIRASIESGADGTPGPVGSVN